MGSRTRSATAWKPGRAVSAIVMVFALVASFFASLTSMTMSAQSVNTSLAETVPATSVMYANIDLDQTSDQWTQVYTLLDRAGLSDLAEEEADTSPEDLGSMAEMYEFTGSAALVLTSADALATANMGAITDQAMDTAADPTQVVDEVPEGLVVVFQPEDPDALYANFQQMVADEAEQAGATVETTDYNGVTIEYWTSDDPSVAATATALVDGTVVLSPRPDDIEPVIDTISGDVESLATNPNFAAVADAFTTDSLMFIYVDGPAMLEAGMASDPTMGGSMMGMDPSMAGYIGMNMYADEAGFHLDTVSLSQDGSTPAPFDPTMASRVPADSLLFVNGSDIAATGFSDLLGMFLQMALAESEMDGMDDVDTTAMATPSVDEVYAELESQLGFNIKTELIDQMDGEWAVAGNVDQIFSDAPAIDLVFVTEIADDMAVGDVTDQIEFIVAASIEEGAATIEDREVEGGTVTSVTIIDAIAPGQDMVLEWAVINGEFIVGINNGIDSYLSGSTEALADDPIYQQTMEALPSTDVVGILFLNLDRTIPMIEEAAMSMESSMSVLDNDEACGDYASQEEAQAAYDEDEFGLWNLDLDYDGEACEDYFTAASPMASPASMTEDLSILSIGSVSYIEGDMYRNNSILLIGD